MIHISNDKNTAYQKIYLTKTMQDISKEEKDISNMIRCSVCQMNFS